jgi:hypothetical protein
VQELKHEFPPDPERLVIQPLQGTYQPEDPGYYTSANSLGNIGRYIPSVASPPLLPPASHRPPAHAESYAARFSVPSASNCIGGHSGSLDRIQGYNASEYPHAFYHTALSPSSGLAQIPTYTNQIGQDLNDPHFSAPSTIFSNGDCYNQAGIYLERLSGYNTPPCRPHPSFFDPSILADWNLPRQEIPLATPLDRYHAPQNTTSSPYPSSNHFHEQWPSQIASANAAQNSTIPDHHPLSSTFQPSIRGPTFPTDYQSFSFPNRDGQTSSPPSIAAETMVYAPRYDTNVYKQD